MAAHRTATTVAFGEAHLEHHEAVLIEQMTANLPKCPDCGTDGMFLTMWTPFRTVQRILCAICLRSMWEAPTCSGR